MTNPEDRWRHQSPAAPHAPSHDPLTPGLPFGTNQSSSSLGASYNADAVYTGPVNPVALSAGLTLVSLFIVFIFSGPIFGSLYPIATGIAVAAGLATNGVLRATMPNLDSSGRLPFALLATAVVFWPLCRLDYRLGVSVAPYRIARHVARVFLIAGWITLMLLDESGHGYMPRSVGQVQALFADRRFLPVMGVALVVAHLFLTRAKGVRARWAGLLQLLRLRPR